jgi:F0F1-type ATP synthase membrane subunit c/vacuolar-type H+-ATPase subunit K
LSIRTKALLARLARGLVAVLVAGSIGYLASDTVQEAVARDPLASVLVGVAIPLLLTLDKRLRWKKPESNSTEQEETTG